MIMTFIKSEEMGSLRRPIGEPFGKPVLPLLTQNGSEEPSWTILICRGLLARRFAQLLHSVLQIASNPGCGILVGYPDQLRDDIGQQSSLFGANRAFPEIGRQFHFGEHGGGMKISHD